MGDATVGQLRGNLSGFKKAVRRRDIELERLRALVSAQDEYIKLLADDAARQMPFLYVHGYICPPELVERGKELREKIANLKP